MDEMKKINVLISLHKGYGIGDAVQMSPVLQHVNKYRPNWIVDYQAEEGKHQVGRGIVANTFAYGSPYPTLHYDAEVQICLYDTWANWHDRPNTRVSSCLHECFGLDWDRECGRYYIQVSKEALWQTSKIIPRRSVALHYQGDSSPDKKNLTHGQAWEVCDTILKLGRIPLLLDWRKQWPLSRHGNLIHTTGGYPFSQEWGRDIEMNCAVISQCEAFIGIDSGPSKCASATETPTLVTWSGHHPACFHDPAINTTHLVPVGYHGLEPVCGDEGTIRWFEANHKIRQYESDPVKEIEKWLVGVLR